MLCPLSHLQVQYARLEAMLSQAQHLTSSHANPAPPFVRPQTFLYNNFRKAVARHADGHANADAPDETDDDDDGDEVEVDGTGAGGGASARRGVGKLNYSNCLMQLRKLCNHPYLLLEGTPYRASPHPHARVPPLSNPHPHPHPHVNPHPHPACGGQT